MRVKRTGLRHETRILQLLQGHDAIPAVYAYGQLEHFEYISMEILGMSVSARQKANGLKSGLTLTTVIRIVDQVVCETQIPTLGNI